MDLSEAATVNIRRHPWEIARLYFFRKVICNAGLHLRPLVILDVGSGDGWLARNLAPYLDPACTITCWDAAYSDDQLEYLNAASSTIKYVSQKPSGRYDLVMMLDVLEHINDDQNFLLDVVEGLIGSGDFLLLSVPAWRSLFGPHDEQLRHFRRYTPVEITRLLSKCALNVLSDGGVFASLLLPRILQVAAARLHIIKTTPHAGEWRGGLVVSCIIEFFLILDVQISLLAMATRIRLPGVSCWALCQKP